jgi:hypothetical protein
VFLPKEEPRAANKENPAFLVFSSAVGEESWFNAASIKWVKKLRDGVTLEIKFKDKENQTLYFLAKDASFRSLSDLVGTTPPQ